LSQGLSYTVSILINVVNTVLKLLLITLIAMIREDTKSEMMRSIKIGVFLTVFFNTGILILLASANMTETHFPFFSTVLTGSYTDFNSGWYTDVGRIIIQAMLLNAFMPAIEFGIGYSMKFAFRLMDRSYTKDFFKSKKKSIQLYIDTYSGPEYNIHFRYSQILNTTFVTLMYGTAMPQLYFYAFLTFAGLYILERCQVCYYYKQPPSFDETMTMNCLDMMAWAPVVYMAFSYWQLSNNQIFANVVFKIDSINDIIMSGHTIISEFSDMAFDQSFPCLLLFFFLLFSVPLSKVFFRIMAVVKPSFMALDLNVDENLNNYFEALE